MFASLAILASALVVCPFLGRRHQALNGWLVAVAMAASTITAIAAYLSTDTPTESVAWMPSIGVHISLRMDGLSFIFTLMVLLIGTLVMVYSTKYLPRGDQWTFYTLMTAFATSMLLLVLTDNLIVFYVAWELTTLCSFFLIARSGADAREPAIRTLLTTVLGGLILLAAVLTMAVATGTTSITGVLTSHVWANDPRLTTIVAVLVVIAALTKSAQFPFQYWLPDSMVAITPVSTYLHAATMVKAGIYLLLRFSPIFSGVGAWTALLVTAGGLTALFGAVAALRRFDLKELLAYSTMSQLGLLVLMIGVGTEASLQAAVVHTIAHALFKSALFMAVGVIDHEAGTRDSRQLATKRLDMPVTKAILLVGSASMAGLPPLLGFVSKEGMFTALLDGPAPWFTVGAAALTSICTFAYSGRLVLGARGEATSNDRVHEGPPLFWLAPATTASAGLILGLVPFVLDDLVGPAASAVTGAESHPHLALWHGVNLPLLISLTVFGAGTLMVLLRRPIEAFMVPRGLPIAGTRVVDRLRSGTIYVGSFFSAMTGTNSTRRHLAIPIVCAVGIGAYGIVGISGLPERVEGVEGEWWRIVIDIVLLALIAVGVLLATSAHTRVSAIVVVGVAGFAMVLWFFNLGASDVALTQLMVEILTVCVMVLLLRRLPATFAAEPGEMKGARIALSIVGGIGAAVGTWALTGRRDYSDAARYYLAEGPSETGGANIVNTILVDFRALDTLGELTVLGVAGITIVTLLQAREANPVRDIPLRLRSPLASGRDGTLFIRTAAKLIGPLTVVLSVVLFFRGHQEPGGGFIAALVGGAGFALLYLSAPTDKKATVRLPHQFLIGSGIVVGAATGVLGYLGGSYLKPLHPEIFGMKVTTSLVFDLGVYLAVIGLVVAAFNLLGSAATPDPDDEGHPGDYAGGPFRDPPIDQDPDVVDQATAEANAGAVTGEVRS